MECFRLLLEHPAWIEHQVLSGIRDSRKAGSLWGMMRGVRGVGKTEHRSLLAKGLGLGLLRWGFKGVQEEISWEESSTLQNGSVAFPAGQCTSPQFHSCHGLFVYPHPPYSRDLAPCDFWLFPISEAVVMRRQLGRWHAHTRGQPQEERTSALQPEEITLKGTRVSYVYYQ